ncbi:ATP-binding protein [Streptomyces sp. NRRL S-813]|uniref:ATP-binding protein n=1 Tax=Streptomyces sp. NRRL S-813 TaxID=1463919 RepID=UPI000689F0BD|nr:ATP-binding protein [Streptomyces sp. NRRL S-813]
MTLSAQAALVCSVRRFTNDLLRLWQIGDEEREAAVLIVDELVVNAVQHGRTDMTLLLTLNGATLRIAVADTGPRVPHPDSRLDADEHGRGVGIIEHLADRVEFHESERRCLAYAWMRVTPLSPTLASSSPIGLPATTPAAGSRVRSFGPSQDEKDRVMDDLTVANLSNGRFAVLAAH